MTESAEQCFPQRGHILQLSDEVLLMILRHLSFQDLYNLYLTCTRLQRVCQEKELYHTIDPARDDYDTLDAVFYKFLGPRTLSLKVESKCHGENPGYKSSISHQHLAQLSPTLRSSPFDLSLTHLYLIRQRLDKSILNLRNLPTTLRVLHLTGTVVPNVEEASYYFRDAWKSLPNLEDFDLTDCTWVPSHSLLGLSKLSSLRRLSLQGCRQIGNCLAYASLAFRFGFKALKILDVTNTQFGSVEFESVSLARNLEEFYVGEYDSQESSSSIQDFSLSSLVGLESLRVIDLSGHDITDSGLNRLLFFPSLRKVDAHFTSITPEAIERFMERKRGCIVNKSNASFGS